MKIIAAARATGKTYFVDQMLKADKSLVLVCPRAFMRGRSAVNNWIDPKELAKALHRYGGQIDFGGNALNKKFIIEEPAMYDKEFLDILKRLPEENIELIIGTPRENLNVFNMWLNANKKRVIRWTHVDPGLIFPKGQYAERFWNTEMLGEFEWQK